MQITDRTKCETKFYIFYAVMQPDLSKINPLTELKNQIFCQTIDTRRVAYE